MESRIQIVHEVLVQHRLQREVAAKHRVSIATVSSLCKKAQNNQSFLKELVADREAKAERRRQIGQTVLEMNQLNVFVDSARSVKKVLLEGLDMEASERQIRTIMREDLGMRYRKILPVSIHGNSEKNLVLR